jgi:hypothetical protein
MTKERTVKIGDDEFVIQRFRGLKAIMAMATITRIARDVPNILADASRDFHKRNTITITEPMSKLPRWDGFTKADFDAAEQETGKREIELPNSVTQQEQVLIALPALLENARKEVIRLLAILIIPNQDLREADENDRVETALDKYKDVLLYDAEIDQLAELVIVAQEVMQDQLSSAQKEKLGNLARSLMRMIRGQNEITTPTLPELKAAMEASTSNDTVPDSPTDSQPSIDGTEEPLSTVSPGAS